MGCCCSRPLEDEDAKEVRRPLLSDDDLDTPSPPQGRKYDSTEETSPKQPASPVGSRGTARPPLKSDGVVERHQSAFRDHISETKALQSSVSLLEEMYPEANTMKSLQGCVQHLFNSLADKSSVALRQAVSQRIELVLSRDKIDNSILKALDELNKASKLASDLLNRGPQLSKSICDSIADACKSEEEATSKKLEVLRKMTEDLEAAQRETTDIRRKIQAALDIFKSKPDSQNDYSNKDVPTANLLDLGDTNVLFDNSASEAVVKVQEQPLQSSQRIVDKWGPDEIPVDVTNAELIDDTQKNGMNNKLDEHKTTNDGDISQQENTISHSATVTLSEAAPRDHSAPSEDNDDGEISIPIQSGIQEEAKDSNYPTSTTETGLSNDITQDDVDSGRQGVDTGDVKETTATDEIQKQDQDIHKDDTNESIEKDAAKEAGIDDQSDTNEDLTEIKQIAGSDRQDQTLSRMVQDDSVQNKDEDPSTMTESNADPNDTAQNEDTNECNISNITPEPNQRSTTDLNQDVVQSSMTDPIHESGQKAVDEAIPTLDQNSSTNASQNPEQRSMTGETVDQDSSTMIDVSQDQKQSSTTDPLSISDQIMTEPGSDQSGTADASEEPGKGTVVSSTDKDKTKDVSKEPPNNQDQISKDLDQISATDASYDQDQAKDQDQSVNFDASKELEKDVITEVSKGLDQSLPETSKTLSQSSTPDARNEAIESSKIEEGQNVEQTSTNTEENIPKVSKDLDESKTETNGVLDQNTTIDTSQNEDLRVQNDMIDNQSQSEVNEGNASPDNSVKAEKAEDPNPNMEEDRDRIDEQGSARETRLDPDQNIDTEVSEDPDESFLTEGSEDPNQSTNTEDDIFHDTRDEESLDVSKEVSTSLESGMSPTTSSEYVACTERSEEVLTVPTSPKLQKSKIRGSNESEMSTDSNISISSSPEHRTSEMVTSSESSTSETSGVASPQGASAADKDQNASSQESSKDSSQELSSSTKDNVSPKDNSDIKQVGADEAVGKE